MDPITRKETFLAKAGGQDVTTPTPVTREEYFLNEIANGGGGSSNKFIVTLTPTAQDFSGVMDKTVEEINTAYEDGQEIWFSLNDGEGSTYSVPCDMIIHNLGEGINYNDYCAKVLVYAMDAIVLVRVNGSGGTTATYSTYLYSLTPLS